MVRPLAVQVRRDSALFIGVSFVGQPKLAAAAAVAAFANGSQGRSHALAHQLYAALVMQGAFELGVEHAGVDDIAKGAFCAVSARWRIELQLRTASLVHAHMRNWASQCRIALRPNLEGLQHVFASSIECVRAQIRLRLRRCGCLHQSHAQALFC